MSNQQDILIQKVDIKELTELSIPNDDDILLIEEDDTGEAKKIKVKNLVSNDTIENAVDAWLDAHPEATTTVEDGSITPAKLHQDTLDMFDEKADIDGYYEDMSVGSAEQLLSNTYEPDSTPYLYRTSGGSLEIGDRVYEDAIVGGSVAWNQLALFTQANIPSASHGVTYSYTDGTSCAISGTADSNGDIRSGWFYLNETNGLNGKSGHKMLLASKKISGTGDIKLGFTQNNASVIYTNLGTATIQNVGIYQSQCRLYTKIEPDTAFSDFEFTFIVHDLTQMFGSTIADYIYALEQSEAGSGIAWLKSQGFFTKNYYAYNAGGIQSVKTSAKKVVGFNQWDEQYTFTGINANTGAIGTWTDRLTSKNYINIISGASYYFHCGGNGNFYVHCYDDSNTWLGLADFNGEYYSPAHGALFNVMPGTKKIKFSCTSNAYGTTYNNDICINLHWDGERDGEYEAYEEHNYPLDSDLELRGIPKLDSSNKLYYDGDVYESDGTVTRKYTEKEPSDFSNIASTDINETTGMIRFVLNTSNLKKVGVLNVRSNLFSTASTLVQDTDTVEGISGYNGGNSVYVVIKASRLSGDLSTSGGRQTAFLTWSSANGLKFVYELATPTTESADPYTSPQWVDNWGTEEFVDTRDVPIPVGHESRYLPDLKAKVESAPNNPSTNGKYFLQYENGQATYVPVPSEVPQTPSEDGTYVLKATVSSGTATLAWVTEE